MKKERGMTLIEVLLVTTIIMVVGIAFIVLLSPKTTIEKAFDAKRKHELKEVQKAFESFYNDKVSYPRPDEVCFDSPQQMVNGTYICHLCGKKLSNPTFQPYLPILPCDPESPAKEYVYQVDNLSKPSWYRVYAQFSNSNDPQAQNSECKGNCSPGDGKTYSYTVSSPNAFTGKKTDRYACYQGGCTFCCYGGLDECEPEYRCDQDKLCRNGEGTPVGRIYYTKIQCEQNCTCGND